MAGFVSDFARRPRGVKIATFAAIGGLLGLVYWQMVYEPIQDDITKARADVVAEIKDEKDLRKERREFDDLVTRKKGLSTRIEQNQKALPTEAEMPAFFDMLARKVTEAGVEGQKRELKKEVTIDPNAGQGDQKPANAAEAKAQAAAAAAAGPTTIFLKVPVEFEISGTFYQLKRFFASLRARPQSDAGGGDEGVSKDRLVTIENLTLGDPRVRNSELVLTAKFTASTFRAVTEGGVKPEGAAGAAAAPGTGAAPGPASGSATGTGTGTGAGSGSGSGSGSGASATSNRDLDGPANTPRAVKAQVGAAADVADKRNRSVDPDDTEGGP